MEEKQGIITDIIYHNEENGYTIAVMETSDEQFTAVGMLPENALGNTFLLRGAFKNHPKYGEQFSFTEAEAVLPSSADEIEGFLAQASGASPETFRLVRNPGREDDYARIIVSSGSTVVSPSDSRDASHSPG